MFFRSYTEKVWGIPCSEIGADWAAQRIKGLSLGVAVRNALFGSTRGKTLTTLIDEFRYPRLGPGQLWENAAKRLSARGWRIRLNTPVIGVECLHNRVVSVKVRLKNGEIKQLKASHLFSSMPLRTLLQTILPMTQGDVLNAANALKYRDFLTVVLVIDQKDVFPDNWIYIHDPQVRMGRIQNFKNWSPHMVPDQSTTCLGLEYFVNHGDELWNASDEKLIAIGWEELTKVGLASGTLIKGYVVRMPKAYPVYDTGYQERLEKIRGFLGTIENLYCIGRNGQHRYNNQDHSMATALIAARHMSLGDQRDHWAVNEDAEYHEIAQTERQAPVTRAAA
jgi:protoporphyrinogen oxidase